MAANTFYDILKANPYHDERGRFTTAPNARNPMIRTAPPPKKTKLAYKVFVVKNGKLYPPMVANPDGMDTPVGVWLDAAEGTMATDKDGKPITNTLGRNKVKAGGKGTQGGSGTLAYRPGWHLGELPEAKQFYTKDKVTGEKKQKKNFVWAECEIAADFDYQEEAMSYGYNKNGKFQHSLAGLPKIPKDGYYTYRTNPDPTTQPWYITGSMKVNRILTDKETNAILRSHGIEPMKRDGGELDLKALGLTETNFVKKSEAAGGFAPVAKTFEEIIEVNKFNPYHDSLGRFTTAGSYSTFTYAPGKSKAHDLAIARQKERMARIMPSEAQAKTLRGIENRTRNLKKEQFRVVDRDGNIVMQKQGDKHSVSYSVGEARDNFSGNITIHNHPDGGTFSTADLSDIGYGATEIRAAAPEGTYILRNMRHGARYNAAKEKTWVDMREDLDAATEGFKTHRQIKSEIRKPFDAQMESISSKWVERKNAGASKEELDKIYSEYTSLAETIRPQIEAAARKAYVDQHHHWIKQNAGKYGLEYEFVPIQTKTRKSYMEFELTETISKGAGGDVVLDAKMHQDIEEITDDIISDMIADFPSVQKSDPEFSVFKTDDDKRLVFGWASISINVDGEQLEDRQKDMIDPEDLEEAAYEYVLNFRDTGEEHIKTMRKKGKLVESCVFTAEKQKAIGIPEGTLPIGWWIGFKIEDDDAWERVKNGTYRMFSIEGKANRIPVEKAVETVEKATPNYDEFPSYDMWLEENLDATIEEQRAAKKHYQENKTVAKTFSDILKFNPYHDARGRFASANSYSSFTIRTKDPKKQHMADMAVAREKERTAAASANPTNDPDTIGGVKRGRPMTHEQADEGRGNPHYNDLDTTMQKARDAERKWYDAMQRKVPEKELKALEAEKNQALDEYNKAYRDQNQYRINCQSCVVAYEARRRGYDVEAVGRTKKNQSQEDLAHDCAAAWVDPATGNAPKPLVNDPKIRTAKQTQKWLEQNIEEGGRYHLSHGWKGTNGRNGHIVTVEKDSSGALRIFDPQNGKTYAGSDATDYLGRTKATYSRQRYNPRRASGWESVPEGRLRLLRVDNLQLYADVVDDVLRGS